ncbi:MAG: hypothetical protein ACFFB5_01425 [Promethearchaeota archaeon]
MLQQKVEDLINIITGISTLDHPVKEKITNNLFSINQKVAAAEIFFSLLNQVDLSLIYRWNDVSKKYPDVKQQFPITLGKIQIKERHQIPFIIVFSIDNLTYNLKSAIDIISKLIVEMFEYTMSHDIYYPRDVVTKLLSRPTSCNLRNLWETKIGIEPWNINGWYYVLIKIRNHGTHEDIANYGNLTPPSFSQLTYSFSAQTQLILRDTFFNPGFQDKEMVQCFKKIMGMVESFIINTLEELIILLRNNGNSLPLPHS